MQRICIVQYKLVSVCPQHTSIVIKMAQQTELVFSNFQLCYKGIQVLKNVGQCPTWWSPCRIYMAPSVQRRKVWLTPTTRCRAVMLPRRETSWNLQGSPKLVNRSHPLVGRRSPYCGDMWRTYCCLTSFFSDCRYVPQLRRYSLTKLCDGAQMAIFGDFFCVLCFKRAACSRFQTCILNSH